VGHCFHFVAHMSPAKCGTVELLSSQAAGFAALHPG
jgi:hypothetical protein